MSAPAVVILFSCLLLLLAVCAEHFPQRWRFPAVGWLLLVGLGYGLTRRLGPGWLPAFALRPDVVVFVFLPVLIFGSSRKLHVRALWAELPEIAYLSLMGPAIGAFLLALPLVLLGGLRWLDALLFGVALAADRFCLRKIDFAETEAPSKGAT